MKVLVSGASGFIGSALLLGLREAGHDVTRLVRATAQLAPGVNQWDPVGGRLNPEIFTGIDAVIHLSGENLAAGRWTPERKARIRDSRVQSTRLLAETMAALDIPPQVFLCASAVGFYGDRGSEILTESSAPGAGFLAGVCRDWEQAAQAAARVETRVANLRFGVVLSPNGGALTRMLTPFRLGLGAVIGSGEQYMSWVALEDAVAIIIAALRTPDFHGPINVVAPHAVTNAEFTRALAKVFGKPARLRMPAAAARLLFGEMGQEVLLSGQRVYPQSLVKAGFGFRYPRVEELLARLGQEK